MDGVKAIIAVVPKSIVDRSGYDTELLKSFEKVTGIKKTRHWDKDPMELVKVAVEALKPYLAGNDISSIVFVTQSPQRRSPCMAMDVLSFLGQKKLDIPVFDVNQSCTGFVYGLMLCQSLSKYGQYSLLICMDQLRASSFEELIFSDAATATLVDTSIPADCCFYSDPKGVDLLKSDEKGLLKMNGGAVFDFVTTVVPPLIKKFAPFHDVIVMHQANLSMMRLVAKRSGYLDKSVETIEEFGNMSMCSIPVALAALPQINKRVLLASFGAGWSVAFMKSISTVLYYSKLYEVQ